MSEEKNLARLNPNEVYITELVPFDQDMYTLCGGDEYVITFSLRDINPKLYSVEFCREDEELNLRPFAKAEGLIVPKTGCVPDAVRAIVLPKSFQITPTSVVDLTKVFAVADI